MKCSLNHYHISCPDKYELAHWYQKKLGFKIIEDVEKLGELNGPLVISGDGGNSGISIFTSKDPNRVFKVSVIPAFLVSSEDFVSFYKTEKKLDPEFTIYDHISSYSLYLYDLMGSRVELTADNYIKTGLLLQQNGIEAKRMNPTHDPAYSRRS